MTIISTCITHSGNVLIRVDVFDDDDYSVDWEIELPDNDVVDDDMIDQFEARLQEECYPCIPKVYDVRTSNTT